MDNLRILYLPFVLKGTIMIQRLAALVILSVTLLSQPSQRSDAAAQSKPRARDLGIELDGAPGPLNVSFRKASAIFLNKFPLAS